MRVWREGKRPRVVERAVKRAINVEDDADLTRLVRSTIQRVAAEVPWNDDQDEMLSDAAFVMIASAHDIAAAMRHGDRLAAIGDLRDILDRMEKRMKEIGGEALHQNAPAPPEPRPEAEGRPDKEPTP